MTKLKLLLLPLECLVNLLSILDNKEKQSFDYFLEFCSLEECLIKKIKCASLINTSIKKLTPNIEEMVHLAYARHCMGLLQDENSNYLVLNTEQMCETIYQDVFETFKQTFKKFAALAATPVTTFRQFSPSAANFLDFFYDEDAKNLSTEDAATMQKIDLYFRMLESKLIDLQNSLKKLQIFGSKLKTTCSLRENLTQTSIHMYKAIRYTLTYEDIDFIYNELQDIRQSIELDSVPVSKRLQLELLLDLLLMLILKNGNIEPDIVQNLQNLTNLIGEKLCNNFKKIHFTFASDKTVPFKDDGGQKGESKKPDFHDLEEKSIVESLPSYTKQDDKDILQIAREHGLEPWSPRLEQHILIETPHKYTHCHDANTEKGIDVSKLNSLLSTDVWKRHSKYQCNSSTINSLLKATVEFCTYPIKYNKTKRQTVSHGSKNEVLHKVLDSSCEILKEALTLGMSYEVMRPFHISPAIVLTECSGSTNFEEIKEEVHKACMLFIMLSAVNHVVFVPSTDTEGNTVIVTESARPFYTLKPRDLNICMVIHLLFFTLQSFCLLLCFLKFS